MPGESLQEKLPEHGYTSGTDKRSHKEEYIVVVFRIYNFFLMYNKEILIGLGSFGKKRKEDN